MTHLYLDLNSNLTISAKIIDFERKKGHHRLGQLNIQSPRGNRAEFRIENFSVDNQRENYRDNIDKVFGDMVIETHSMSRYDSYWYYDSCMTHCNLDLNVMEQQSTSMTHSSNSQLKKRNIH